MKYKNWVDIPPDVRSLKIYKKLEQIEKRQSELILNTAILFAAILSTITLLIWL